ncbi:GPO family capsid scaffolding protein [Aeromonas veronii]
MSGQTTDGRNISADWLLQAAANYNPEKYGARVNLEHYRGIVPDGPFRAYGDVLALSTETITMDGQEKVVLLADIAPNADLLALNKAGQKVYTSIELDLDFAGSGQAYLVGLAVTDSPASLGTEMLKFAAGQGDANPLASRKQRPENLFSSAIETEIELTEADQPGLLERVKAMFKKDKAATGASFTEVHQAVEHIAGEVASQGEQFAASVAKLEGLLDEQKAALAQQAQKLSDLRAELESTENLTHEQLPPAAGGAVTALTDC